MRSPGINGEELTRQPANPGSPGKMAVKTVCVCGGGVLAQIQFERNQVRDSATAHRLILNQ